MSRNIKCVLQFSLYFVGIKIMHMYTYIYSQKLSPTFLWVSKFDVKLGSGGKIFKFTIFTWFFKNHAKSKVFQKYIRQRAFFSKFDVNLRSWGNYCGRSFDQAATLSLRGPAQFTLEARSAEFTGGMGWVDGRGIKSVLQFSLYFVGI